MSNVQMTTERMKANEILSCLRDIVGEKYVSCQAEDIAPYLIDRLAIVSGRPKADYIVLPESVEEVQEIVRLANKYKIVICPCSALTSPYALHLSSKAGIILNLRRLRKIEIDQESMTAVIEPGVSFGELKKEARKRGLQTPVMTGPYAGSPIGCFVCGNVTHYAAQYGLFDRVIALEAILGNGQLIRTGSMAYPGHEKTSPYFKYAYGPDIGGLFRGSLGNFGIITKAVYRLIPLAEREEYLIISFSNIDSLLRTMQRIERLNITSYVMALTGSGYKLALLLAPDIKSLENPKEMEKLRSLFPEYCLVMGLSGIDEQVELHKKMIFDEASKEETISLNLSGEMKQNMDDYILGAGIRVNRLFKHHTAIITSVLPISKVPAAVERVKEMAGKYELRDPYINKPLTPFATMIPWERCTVIYLEFDIPLNLENPDEIWKFRNEATKVLWEEYAGSSLTLSPILESTLMPEYINLVQTIKKSVDPNGVLSREAWRKK